MVKRLGYIFFIFFALVFLDYMYALGVQSAGKFQAALFMVPKTDSNASIALTAISFTAFKKDSSGWNAITQGYGATSYAMAYASHWHDGVDIAAYYGAPIHSFTNGTVLATGNQDLYCPHRGFGKYVAVKDADQNIILWYAHLGTIDVSPGASVAKDDTLGTIGTTGFETGPHLHFSVFDGNGFSMETKNDCGPDPDGKDLDPIPYLTAFGQ